jgi:hypothetical protein
MREFIIAFMLAVAFMAGGTQAIAEEEAVDPKAEVASETELVLTPEEFEVAGRYTSTAAQVVMAFCEKEPLGRI